MPFANTSSNPSFCGIPENRVYFVLCFRGAGLLSDSDGERGGPTAWARVGFSLLTSKLVERRYDSIKPGRLYEYEVKYREILQFRITSLTFDL